MDIQIPHDWKPRPHQFDLFNNFGHGKRFQRGCAVWHRRAGKDSCALNLTARDMFKRVGTYWHLFPEQTQARRAIWNGIDREGRRIIDQFLPPEVRKRENGQEMLIETVNGSIWQMAGSDNYDSLVGSNPVGVVFSEWSLAHPEAWDYIRPIIVENGGWALFIYTPRGRNHGYHTFEHAEQSDEWFSQRLTVDDTGIVSAKQIAQEREAGMSDSKIAQEFYCFKPDAMVACHDRVKPIAEVRKGDVVLTHTGRLRRVKTTISRPYEGDMIRISAFGGRDIVCTPNHPVHICDPYTQKYRWVAAEDVKAGEYVVTPKMKSGVPILRPELARVIAWYVCEGSAAKTNVQFSIGAHEPIYVEELVNDLKSLGLKPKVQISNSVALVHVACVELADFLIGACGSLSHNKRLPVHMLRGNEAEVWSVLFKGDGCVHMPQNGNVPVYAYTTVSEGLAQQVQILGASLGFAGSYTARQSKNSEIRGRDVQGRESYCVQMRQAKAGKDHAARTRTAKNGVLGKVRSVTREHYSGEVHNFSVMYDESYVVNGRSVHNCSFEAAEDDAVIPVDLIDHAMKNEIEVSDTSPVVWGLDVARHGDDSSVLAKRQGPVIHPLKVWNKLDLMQLSGAVKLEWEQTLPRHQPAEIIVDSIGIGAGVVDRLRELGLPVRGLNVSERPSVAETYLNLRSELWFKTKDWLAGRDVQLPKDDGLFLELSGPRYTYTSNGKIQVESKESMKKRGMKSPDRADAVCLTLAVDFTSLAYGKTSDWSKPLKRGIKGVV